MKLRSNLLVGLTAALLAFAGVACNGDTVDDGLGDPGVETTPFDDGTVDDGTFDDGTVDDGTTDDGLDVEETPTP